MKTITCILAAIFLPLNVHSTEVSSPPRTVQLNELAGTSNSIIIIEVGSAKKIGSEDLVRYEVLGSTPIVANFNGACLLGPPGLKAYRKYVVFLSSQIGNRHKQCGDFQIRGIDDAFGLEIEKIVGGVNYVRLDNRRIISPKLKNSLVIRSELEVSDEANSGKDTYVLGTVVPLADFINHLVAQRRSK
jgi:hypothetical protein